MPVDDSSVHVWGSEDAEEAGRPFSKAFMAHVKQTESHILEITRHREEERGWAGTAGKRCTSVFVL